jgi:uncharacterized protein (TIGR02231 family)
MTPIETNLIAVVLYPDRARLTRQGKITLEPGSHTLEISDLPLELDPESLRTAARGTAHARLLGVQAQRTFYTETPVEKVQQLETQLEAAQDELRSLDAQAESIKYARAALAAILSHTDKYALGLAGGEMSLQAQVDLFDHIRQQIQKSDGESLSLTSRRREVERRIEQLKNQLDQLRSARPRQRYTALMDIEVLQAGELTAELSYLVSGAAWKPLYDLRLVEDKDRSGLELTYLAEVSQITGEPWQSIRLSLSTAQPALAVALPELDPWYVGPRPPAAPLARTAKADGPARMMFAEISDEDETFSLFTTDEVQAQIALASVDTSGLAVTYHVPHLVNIPADGQPHKVTVAQVTLPARLDYTTAPKLVEAIYRRARVANDSPYTLLPGSASLFAGDEYIGATRIELTATQGEIELYLGVEDRIKVERELKRREVEKTLIGGKRRIHFGYQTTVENLLDRQAQVTLHDQAPVPRHEDIKIRLETADPRPSQQSELNLLDWELTLAAKEKRLVRFDFVVEFPQGMELVGLEI